ncbi:MAG: 4-carboxymuconolactone decarboxylase [Miltoncostaeaceae bacterium]|nr:4-carboxymuconolactone decarboxylase [Miltoncostaeaceae bacterium]
MAADRYERGLEVLRELDPAMAEQLQDKLGDLAPDLEKMVVAFGFGDVYGRPGLGLREREIATVAALTALGTAERQLRVHLRAALNVGVTREELVEVVIQMAVYAGFPAALNGISAIRQVFAEADAAAG